MNTTCSTSLTDLVRLLAGIASARAMLAGNADAAAAVPRYFKNSRRSVLMRIHTSLDCSLGNRVAKISPAVLRFRDDSVFSRRLAVWIGSPARPAFCASRFPLVTVFQ